MSDFVPIRLQDFLHGGKPGLPEKSLIRELQ
jgi:hypothetical protein